MQIALTNKLAKALGLKPTATNDNVDPLFTWTANWTKVWDNRRTEDLLVLVNNATRFAVAIYQIKRKDLKNMDDKIRNAIKNTLLEYNLNIELVDAYLELMGELEYTKNSSRHAAAWVSKAGMECAFDIGRKYNGIDKMYSDIVAVNHNHRIVNYSNNQSEGFYPYKAMINALESLTGIQPYKCQAYELSITLDLELYKAKRTIIVPADISFMNLHNVIQDIFDWRNAHLYDFTICNKNTDDKIMRLVPFEDDLEYDNSAVLMKGYRLSDVINDNTKMLYTYDFGDNWIHEIELNRVIEAYDSELPYLLEATGQTPPEDVGGLNGFLEFRKIMLDENHPYYEENKRWSGYWTPELSEWKTRPRVINNSW